MTEVRFYVNLFPPLRQFQNKKKGEHVKTRVVLVAAAFLVVLASFAQAGQVQGQVFKISVQTANIRSLPSVGSPVVGKAEKGAELQVIGRQEGWLEVVFTDDNSAKKVGYVAAWLGNIESRTTAVPVTAVPVKEEPSEPVKTVTAPLNVVLVPKAEGRAEVPETTRAPERSTQPAVQPKETPVHRFGAGLYLAGAPGGLVPSVMYDVSDRATVVGAFGLYSGVTSVMGEVLYRFPQPPKADSKVTFEPYVGGGLILANVSYGFGYWSVSENFTGIIGSGGTFMTIKEYPRWRFSGDINVVQIGGQGVSVAGMGLRIGVHYLF